MVALRMCNPGMATTTLIAHRGASAHAPENTLAAFDLALEMGADVIELDIRVTADGALVVLHDATLLRTCDDPRAIADVTAAELRSLDSPPPLLDEVLSRYGCGTRYLLDLKDPCAPVERLVAEAVRRHAVGACVEVQTFCRRGLRRARDADPAVSLSQLYLPFVPAAAIRFDLARVARFANAIGPESASVTAALVRAAHARGLRVQPYTVNDPAEAQRLLALGVDGLITDMPQRARLSAAA